MTERKSPRSTERTTTKREAPFIPTPSEEKIRRGAPSLKTTYIRDGIQVYKHKDGRNRIRFLAWRQGEHFLKFLWVHRGLGVESNSYACPLKNKNIDGNPFGDCPICEDIKKRLDSGEEWETLKDEGILLGRHPRILAQVVDRNEEERGIQIWDVTAFEIDDAIKVLSQHEDTKAIIPWTDPENGRDLLYHYDASADFAMPKQLTRGDVSKISSDFYYDILDFDTDVIYWPTYEELQEAYRSRVVDEEEPAKEETEPDYSGDSGPEETAEEESASQEDCLGKDFGKYSDCDDCPDREDCKEKVEGKPSKPSSPRRRR